MGYFGISTPGDMAEESQGSEHRRFERFDVDCRVKVVRKRLGNISIHYGRASNISVGGMMLTVPIDLEAGETMDLEFNLPHMTKILRLQSVVRRRFGEYSYGLEFRDLTAENRQSITRMCETLSVL